MTHNKSDLIILVADKDIEQALSALLTRSANLGIKNVNFNISIHPRHDPGVYNEAESFLRLFLNDYKFALVVLDYEGSGQEALSPEQLETNIEAKLKKNGWENRTRAIAIAPEIEGWALCDYRQLGEIIEWNNSKETIEEWLIKKDFILNNESPCLKPKDAFEAILKAIRRPKSSAIFKEIALSYDFRRCRDRSFCKLLSTLQEWFSLAPYH